MSTEAPEDSQNLCWAMSFPEPLLPSPGALQTSAEWQSCPKAPVLPQLLFVLRLQTDKLSHTA